MSNYFKTILLAFLVTGFFFVADSFLSGNEPDLKGPGRARLLNKLLELDLASIARGDKEYLAAIGAGFDEDNQQYFVEQQVENTEFSDSTILIIISYSLPERVCLTIFPPEDGCYQWLDCRLRLVNGDIFCRALFQPEGNCSELIRVQPSVNGSSRRLALLTGQ